MTTPSTPPDLDARTDAPSAAAAHAHAGARDSTAPTLFPASMNGLLAIFRPYLWAAPLLGGLMLLVHFWRVGYLPALSFAELGVVLGAFGLFVAVGAAAFVMLVLLPAAAVLHWTGFSLLPAPPKAAAQLVVRRKRSLSRRILPVLEEEAGPLKRRTFSARMWPGGFGMFWGACASAFALTLVAVLVVPRHLDATWTGWPVPVLMWGGMLLSFCIYLLAESGWCARRLKIIRKPLPQYLMLLSLYVFLWPAWLVFLYSFDALPQSVAGWCMLAFLACFLVPITHWFWYATLRGMPRIVAEVRAVTSVMMLLFSGIWIPLLDGAASTFGFGMMRGADLVLTERGCAIVREALPGQGCVSASASTPAVASAARSNRAEQAPRDTREARAETAVDPQGAAEGGERSAADARSGAVAGGGHPTQAPPPPVVQVWRLDGVDVLTRIGADYVITPAGGIDDRTLPRATLPADEVLALIRRAPSHGASHAVGRQVSRLGPGVTSLP